MSFPPFSCGWAVWFALVPLFIALAGAGSPKESATLASLTALCFYALSLYWLFRLFGMFAISLICVLALFWAGFGYFYFKLSPWKKVWISPFLWVGLEYFRSEVWFLQFPWLSLGLSHYRDFFSSLLQLNEIWGVYGNSFLILFVNALLTTLFIQSKRNSKIFALATVILVTLVAVPLTTGSLKKNESSQSETRSSRFLLVQSEGYSLDELIELTLRSKFRDGIVLWPEYQVPILPGKRLKEEAYRRISELAKKTNNWIIAGCAEFVLGSQEFKGKEKLLNYAAFFSSDGKMMGTYAKRHPIPLMESIILIQGKTSVAFDTPFGKIGPAICYDMDFSESFVKLSRTGFEIAVVPSLDPLRWGKAEHLQHASIAPVRAVESRKWIVRACSSGPSQIVNSLGQEVAVTSLGQTGFMEGSAQPRTSRTFYHRCFWPFPWLCVIFSFGFLAWCLKLFLETFVKKLFSRPPEKAAA